MSHTFIRRAPAALVALVVACAVTACGGGHKAPAATGSAATARGAIGQGGTLTFGATLGVEQLDPNTINSAAQQPLLTLLWNGLTKWSPAMTVQPDLATSWTH